MLNFISLTKKFKNIQIIDRNKVIKILGTYFITDLQKTSTFNWEQTTKIFDKQLQHLSRRHLSLRGKAILLNSMIFSKITFLSIIFPIPTNILTQIESKIFKNIWPFTTKEPLAR